ncbi:MAG: LegC family aminotransferase [Sediminibacterium magnilacihabitans]|nr:LegC family aminotransferase [Sediminibacterium magnilacihabitans]PQV60068.1 perosamine synthetase [Sediminibacterium magnilacihabitans]
MANKFGEAISIIREAFHEPEAFIPLHEPRFIGNEKRYVLDAIDSTFVSSVGKYVDTFEKMMGEMTGAKFAIATVNGTAALHIALLIAGVKNGDEVITQPITFVATSNAISYCGAGLAFVDVDLDTMGMSPASLEAFLTKHCEKKDGGIFNKSTGRRIAACVPMHTFGMPCHIEKIAEICELFGVPLVEDSAESLGSYYNGKHTGTFGELGIFSFNGNKTITSGGGGAIVTDDEQLAKLAKHITTTAKIPHKWEYEHDMVGYNYRMPNLNAALACAQLEKLNFFIENKRELAAHYNEVFPKIGIPFTTEIERAKANYWLMVVRLQDEAEKNQFLQETNGSKVMTRPIWRLLNKLPMYNNSFCMPLSNSLELEATVVNIPSSARI